MAISSGNDPSGFSTLSEINVTPLVDVMLVLLTIFMVASSVETIQVAAEREQLMKEKQQEEEKLNLLARLEKMKEREVDTIAQQNRDRRQMLIMEMEKEKFREVEEQIQDQAQNVPIELPKTTSEAVNLAEQKKLVITLTGDFKLFIGDTQVVDCLNAPEFSVVGDGEPPPRPADLETLGREELRQREELFRQCLGTIERKLVSNEKLKADQECYLRSDRRIHYGNVLALMATIRRSGVTKFGLVADQEDESAVSGAPSAADGK